MFNTVKVITIKPRSYDTSKTLPHDVLDIRWVSKGRSLLLLTIFRRNISPSSSCFKKEGIAIVPEEQAYEKDTLFHPNVRYLEASMLTGLLRTFAARKA